MFAPYPISSIINQKGHFRAGGNPVSFSPAITTCLSVLSCVVSAKEEVFAKAEVMEGKGENITPAWKTIAKVNSHYGLSFCFFLYCPGERFS